MGRVEGEAQKEFWVSTQDMPRSPGHPFYERLNQVLDQGGFDRFCESQCRRFHAEVLGRPSVAPGRYFHTPLVDYFEKLDSERGIEWHCQDSLSLRAFLRLSPGEIISVHSSLSRTRHRVYLKTHRLMFEWTLKRLAEKDLFYGSDGRRGFFDERSQRRDVIDRLQGQRSAIRDERAARLPPYPQSRPHEILRGSFCRSKAVFRGFQPIPVRGRVSYSMLGHSILRLRACSWSVSLTTFHPAVCAYNVRHEPTDLQPARRWPVAELRSP